MSFEFNKNLFLGENEPVFTTGFEDIDYLLKYCTKGSIITIGGRPSMGKTAFAINILNNLLEQNKKVIYFSVSTSATVFERKLLVSKTQTEFKKLIKSPDIIDKAVNFYKNKELIVSYKNNTSVEDIEKLITEHKPDVVFIDYIQLIKMPKAPNFSDSINLAVQEIKRIADETGCIFVILTQLSRALENRCDKRPLLTDIRSCSLLEELSNVVMMIYREEYYNRENIENKGKAEIILLKNDFGGNFWIPLLFQSSVACFKNPIKTCEF